MDNNNRFSGPVNVFPDRLSDLLFRFLRQNDGRLPKRRREKEFSALTDGEVARIEEIFEESFSGFEYA